MPFKRREEPTSIEEERDALRAQHAALDELKRQLSERVDAVRERELELHHALAEADRSGDASRAAAAVGISRATAVERNEASNTGETALVAARREKELSDRERVLAAREAQLDARARELDATAGRSAAGSPAEPDADRLARIEARLAELRDAEKLFLRTRDELAARSEAVAARERLVSQKERELDEREDSVDGRLPAPAISEMEARLRKLEQQQDPGSQTLGFSGGLRRLEQGTRPKRPG
jgi:hypothetical protein